MDMEIWKLIDKAEDLFYERTRVCEKIEENLGEMFPEEKDYIKDVSFKPHKGLCVCYGQPSYFFISPPVSIPIAEFLNGKRL